MSTQQSTSTVFMVTPTTFGFDKQTARSNTFQHEPSLSQQTTRELALSEFNGAVATLRAHGVDVTIFTDTAQPAKPNAAFPNNWLSTWPDGHIFLYPMATESRRNERSEEALELLKQRFNVATIIDLSSSEATGHYLESTGVMIFHHPTKTVYGCLSVRCHETLFEQHAAQLGYTPIVFHAVDELGVPIYHTNVMMAVQSTTAVVCFEAIKDLNEQTMLRKSLENAGLEVVDITYTQMNSFCGNVLELQTKTGDKLLALSQTAFNALTASQIKVLSQDKALVPLSIPTIELVGGGSVRCMLAEVFLPNK